MFHTNKENPTTKKLNYLLHKHVSAQESTSKLQSLPKPEDKSLEKSFTKTNLLPMISTNTKYKNIANEQQRTVPVNSISHNKENEYRQGTNNQITGNDYIQVNKSILKMIEEKIYPMNKELTKKMKFRHNHSCETLRNSKEQKGKQNGSGDKGSIQKNSKRKMKKKQLPRAGDISDEKLGVNKQKRTKSQEEIIKLQAKVESYLRDRKKLLKFKYDEEMQNIACSSLNSSKASQIAKEQAKQRTIKRLLTIHSSKNKKTINEGISLNNTLTIEKESEIRRVLKLFQERGQNYTSLETGRQNKQKKDEAQKPKFQVFDQKQDQNDKLKSMAHASTKDLSRSLKLIAHIVNNKKLEPLKQIPEHHDLKNTSHRDIIIKTQMLESGPISRSGNNSRSQKRILVNHQIKDGLLKINRQQMEEKLRQKSKKKLTYVENTQKQDAQQNKQNQETIQNDETKMVTERNPQKRRTAKMLTGCSIKSGKSVKDSEKQKQKEKEKEKQKQKIKPYCPPDLMSEKSYKILPSREGKALDKELLVEIQQELLDEKKNLLKRKINQKKLMKRRKDSYIVGIEII